FLKRQYFSFLMSMLIGVKYLISSAMIQCFFKVNKLSFYGFTHFHSSLLSPCHVVFFHSNSKETHYTLITFKFCLDLTDRSTFHLELKQEIESCSFFLDRVC